MQCGGVRHRQPPPPLTDLPMSDHEAEEGVHPVGKSVACPALVVVSQWLRLLPVLLVTRGIALSAGKETQHPEEEEQQKMGSCCTRGVCAVDDCYPLSFIHS